MQNDSKKLARINEQTYLIPVLGFIAGLSIWVLDAYIDVFFLQEEQTLLDNIFNPEATEFWMRSLVVLVLLGLGLFAQRAISRHIELDNRLLNHQIELEQLVAQRTTELTEKSKQLQIIANQDPLTHLANRRKFNENLKQEFQRFHRHRKSFTIILIDIDYFKKINDQYGHNTGDEVIVLFSEILSETCRCTDTVARWGGEEFIVLSIETDLNQALLQANKIMNSIRSTNFPSIGKVTASIGLCCNLNHDTPEELINHADKALYKAKQSGRDRIEH